MLARLDAAKEDYRLILISDHYTLLRTRGHDATPVPVLLYDSRIDTGRGIAYSEETALNGPTLEDCTALPDVLFARDGAQDFLA